MGQGLNGKWECRLCRTTSGSKSERFEGIGISICIMTTLLFLYGSIHTNVDMMPFAQSCGAVSYDGETEHALSEYDTLAGRPS